MRRGDNTITVKAKYLQLSQAVDVKEEDFVLHPKSHYSDLLAAVIEKHPSLTYTAMLVLIDGAPSTPDTELRDKDEIDFLASPVGG